MKEFIDKLIERLEGQIFSFEERLNYDSKTQKQLIIQNNSIKRAISIVNELAEEYNNDFCEWRKENSNKYVCNAHAEIHDSRVLDWCVCPYCGKKIKVEPYTEGE